MFDISFAELAIVAVLALLVVRPEDLPGLLRSVGKGLGKLKEWSNEWAKLLDDAAKESGADEVQSELKQIMGDDGKLYEAYDIDDFIDSSKKETNDD